MSKITFRADDELVERLEAHDASKSEVLRAALRTYLDGAEREADSQAQTDERASGTTDSEVVALLDRVLEQRLREFLGPKLDGRQGTAENSRRDQPGSSHRPLADESGSSVVVEITPQTVRRQRSDLRKGHTVVAHTAAKADSREREPTDDRLDQQEADGPSPSDTNGDTTETQPSDTDQHSVSDTEGGAAGTRDALHEKDPTRDASDAGDDPPCTRCGTALSDDHVYCPNCGEKAARRLFCDCGDEVRSDWSFCPGCGRRTPAADVLTDDDMAGR